MLPTIFGSSALAVRKKLSGAPAHIHLQLVPAFKPPTPQPHSPCAGRRVLPAANVLRPSFISLRRPPHRRERSVLLWKVCHGEGIDWHNGEAARHWAICSGLRLIWLARRGSCFRWARRRDAERPSPA